jgi:chromosome segregation ATPase
MEMIKSQLNSSFLDEMHDQLEDCKSQLIEMSDLKSQLEQVNEHNTNLTNEIESLKQEMNSEQEKKISYLGQIQSLSDALVQKDGELEERSMEINLLKSQLETLSTNQLCLNQDETRLLRELETYHRELADLQAKFCEAISEKENLLKEIVELNRSQHSNKVDAEFQMKLEEKLNQLQTRLGKTKRMSDEFKGPCVSSHMNESFMVKLDNQIETQLQNKVQI